ncbi:MAG TPA: response regulator [Steroidobacteraceae bacterium]|nr:response regulator [Steroidobacteraceae bacterium]
MDPCPDAARSICAIGASGGGVEAVLRPLHGVTMAAAAALAATHEYRPEIAVLDLSTPDMSGLEVTRRLRQRFPASELTLVAVTGKNGRAYGEARDGNFAQQLLKSVTTDTLVALRNCATLAHHRTGAPSWP